MYEKLASCMRPKCSIYGDMLTRAAHCSTHTDSATCGADKQCKWDESSCDADSSALMMESIPNSCAMKPMFSCGAHSSEAACNAEADCEWGAQDDCSDSGTVEIKQGCSAKETFMYDVMAKTSTDADVRMFAKVAKQEKACMKQTT